jgi:hypothetical protein
VLDTVFKGGKRRQLGCVLLFWGRGEGGGERYDDCIGVMGWTGGWVVGEGGSSQIKIAWSKRRIGNLEFLRVRGEHEAGGKGEQREQVDVA